MNLLKFSTAGSVDDGKSTLIGRLLYDSRSIFEDQLIDIKSISRKRGLGEIDFSLFTDGLKSEREQGITIDVAYRYFSTPRRKFIIADTPGHVQYTRNMVTGASNSDLSLILVDARQGIVEQTLRHTYISYLLGIKYIILCVNKMDLVGYSEKVFEDISNNYREIVEKIGIRNLYIIPISALKGDNIVNRSDNMKWYEGMTLIEILEGVDIDSNYKFDFFRFPVQYVIRGGVDEYRDYRGYAGQVVGGEINVGEEVIVLPSGRRSKVKSIIKYKDKLTVGRYMDSVSIELEDDIDVSRGDVFVLSGENMPRVGNEVKMKLCWFSDRELTIGGKYVLLHNTNETICIVKEIDYKIDINTLNENYSDKKIFMNDICRVNIKTFKPLVYERYFDNRLLGSVILVDMITNETVGAGMIE